MKSQFLCYLTQSRPIVAYDQVPTSGSPKNGSIIPGWGWYQCLIPVALSLAIATGQDKRKKAIAIVTIAIAFNT
jgi:hypothetical protein